MADVTIVYWRDIPAQVIAGRGRRAEKVVLPERFEKAIDMAAMRSGAQETDDYLAEWRREGPVPVEGDDASAAEAEAARLDKEYTQARLRELIDNGGRATA